MTRRNAFISNCAAKQKTQAAVAVCMGLLLFAASATAQTVRLDDSTSPRSRVAPQTTLTDEGRPLANSLEPNTATVNYGRVEYRLATSQYVGRKASIYLVVPPFVPGLKAPAGLRVVWRGNGLFSSGTARPSERRLVWAGVMTGPFMQEALDLSLELNLRDIQLPSNANSGFEMYFEMELKP